MQVEWLKGEDKDNFKLLLTSNKKVLDKLVEILYNRVKEVETTNIGDYSVANWSHLQAHKNGQLEELKSLIRLCTI